MKLDLTPYEQKMQKSISIFREKLSVIRVGRASPAVLDKVTVDYYGAPTPLNGVASIKAQDATTLVIQPWDANMLKDIERAILASDVGITPQNDGKIIRLIFPQLTEERRKELTKQTAKMDEETKVAIRNIRRDANEAAKAAKKAGGMTEDEEAESEEDIQELTDKYIKESDKVAEEKNKEIMDF